MAWDGWPEKLANGEVADANDVLDALDLIKQHVEELEDVLSGGGLVRDDDPRLSDARDPKPHAGSHGPGGADAFVATGVESVVTDGAGWARATITHNLGAAPAWVGVTITSNVTAGTTMAEVSNMTPTTAFVQFPTAVGFHAISFRWVAVRQAS